MKTCKMLFIGFILCASLPTLYLEAGLVRAAENVAEATPPFQGWLVLDGDDDYAKAVDQPELDVGDEPDENLTLEAWINVQLGDHDFRYIVNKALSYDLSQSFDPFNARCIGFTIYFSSGQPKGFIHCRTSAYAYGWNHVAGVYDKTTGEARIYLNGELYGHYIFGTSDLYNSNYPLQAGRYFSAGIDELRISDIARYTDVAFIPPASPLSCDSHTRALWHFDELEGATVLHDMCGDDNTLIGYNGAHSEGVTVNWIFLPFIKE